MGVFSGHHQDNMFKPFCCDYMLYPVLFALIFDPLHFKNYQHLNLRTKLLATYALAPWLV